MLVNVTPVMDAMPVVVERRKVPLLVNADVVPPPPCSERSPLHSNVQPVWFVRLAPFFRMRFPPVHCMLPPLLTDSPSMVLSAAVAKLRLPVLPDVNVPLPLSAPPFHAKVELSVTALPLATESVPLFRVVVARLASTLKFTIVPALLM